MDGDGEEGGEGLVEGDRGCEVEGFGERRRRGCHCGVGLLLLIWLVHVLGPKISKQNFLIICGSAL